MEFNGVAMEGVKEVKCIYLGSRITNDDGTNADISQIIKKFRQVYEMLNPVRKAIRTTRRVRRQIPI